MSKPEKISTGTTGNVLEIYVGEEAIEESREKSLDAVRKAEQGESHEPVNHLVFESYEDLDEFFKSSNMEIINAIRTREPGSVNELADTVDRDYKNVYNNVQELEKLGVIELKQEGRSRRPVFRHEGIEVKLEFA